MFKSTSPAIKVSFFYIFFSILWILFSDSILHEFVKDSEALALMQSLKGIFFILVTAILIYFLFNKYFKEEENLRQSLENVFNNVGVPIVIYNEDGIPLKINNVWFKLTGYKYEEVSTLEKWSYRVFGDKAQDTIKLFKSHQNINKKVGLGEFKINTKDKRVLTWYIYISPYGVVDGKKVFISTALDLTQIRKQENLLVQQSKMAIMGEMIANIAHQWKQPLSTIRASNALLKLNRQYGDFDEKVDESIEVIDYSVENLAHTIDDFRNFFKPSKVINYFKISNSLEKVFKLINAQLINSNIQLIKDIKEIDLYGYENELLQVIINILKNAYDELKSLDKPKKLIFIKTYKDEKYLYLEIKDNAGGIPENIKTKIFDSYFTTKDDDKGTGIGLYMSKKIIEDSMCGRIQARNENYEYENQSHKGAVFKISIPLEPINSIL